MKLSGYLRILKNEEIARRYFVMNSFDGALTVLGIVVAMYIAGKHDASLFKSSLVIISSVGAAVALAVSGVWSAYAAEKAERMRSLRELEKHLLKDLDNTRVSKQMNLITLLVALVNGLSPLLVSLVSISPFILSHLGMISIEDAFYYFLTLVAVILFLLGAFVAKVGKDDIVRGGLKMVLAGVVVGVIIYSLEFLKLV